MASTPPIPKGFHSITAHLVLRDAASAIAFYKRAFGAEEIWRLPGPDGRSIAHAEIRIGDSILMLGEEHPMMQRWVAPPSLNGTTVALALYVEDADKVFRRAVEAGANVSLPMSDAFWGDRYGRVTDPFGHEWSIATHKQDLSPEQIAKGAEAFFSQMGAAGHQA